MAPIRRLPGVVAVLTANAPGRAGWQTQLLIGAFLIERFFGIPGIGREVILAVERSDFPVIKAITVYVAAATMVFNLLTDVLPGGSGCIASRRAFEALGPKLRAASPRRGA